MWITMEEKGIQLKLNQKAIAINGKGNVESVILASGEKISANMVVISTGARCNIELAKNAGLDLGKLGLKVDDYLKTTNPDRIGYFAFTKKAAGEAKERMLDQNPHINEKKFSMFFDTGAKISYIQDDIIETYPKSGIIDDFYPGFGTFQTQSYRVELDILDTQHTLQCGMLPDILGMTLKIGGTDGILGNQLFLDHVVSYHPGKKQICLLK